MLSCLFFLVKGKIYWGDFMFSVRPVCRMFIMSVSVAVLIGLNYFLKDRVVAALSALVVFWLWLHLTGLKVEITEKYIIRYTGNVFKRKSIIMLKNIFHIQIMTIAPWRPAVIRLHGYGKTIIVIGLDSRQAAGVERAVRAR